MKAAQFSLPDQYGKLHALDDYKGKWVVLYFYPKDDTPGCTRQACGFRDLAQDYKKENIVILGVSRDSVASHKKFAEKYRLTFPLLSDESKEMINAYGAWGEKKMMGRTFEGIKRITFIINPHGEIVKEYEKMDLFKHAGEIIADIKTLS